MSFVTYPFKFGTVTPTATMTGWLNTLPWAVYNVTPATRTDGQGGPIEANSTGQLLVDVRAIVPGVGATNLGKAEDAAHSSGDTGVMALAVQKATPADLGADGDYGPIQVSAGRVWASSVITDLVPGVAATNLGKAEDAAHSSGDTGVMALAVQKATPADLGADGDYAPIQVSAGRAWTSSVVTDLVPGVGATNLGKAEDAAHSSGDTGVMALAVQKATPADLGADGDYGPLQVSAGRVWTNTLVTDGTNAVSVETAGADAVSNTNNALSTKARLVGFNGTTWDRLRTAVVAAGTTVTGWLNVITTAIYSTTKPTLTNGQYSVPQCSVNGALDINEVLAPQAEDNTNGVIATQNKPVAVSTYAWSVDRSTALEASTVTKATAGVVRLVTGRIDSTHATATYYIQVLNAASLPADGAVTTLVHPLKIQHITGTDSMFTIDCDMNGVYASTGIVVCISTTEFTKTISGAFLSTTVLYI